MEAGLNGRVVKSLATALALIIIGGCQDLSAPEASTIGAGWSLSQGEISDQELSLASNPSVSLPSIAIPRYGHAAVSLGSCVWVIGGTDNRINSTPFNSVERYCPTIDATRWSAAISLPEGRSDFAGAGVISNKIYAAGGIDASGLATRSLYVYSAATGWTVSPDSLPMPMACGGGGAVIAGKLWVFAGELDPYGAQTCMTSSQRIAVYDPAKPTPPRWRLLPATPPADESNLCNYSTAALGSTLYFVGGGDCAFPGFASNRKYAFNTATKQWVSNLGFRSAAFPAAIALSNRILSFGGTDYGSNLALHSAQTWSYDPASASLDELSLMQSTRNDAGVAALGTTVVIVGGTSSWFGQAVGTAEQVTIVTGCDIHEPDATKANASRWLPPVDGDGYWVPGASLRQAKICSASDVDNFSLNNMGIAPHFQMTPPSGKDYELLLLDANGKVLQRSAQVGSVAETVQLPAGYPGQFFLRVRSQNGSFSTSLPYVLELIASQ